MADQVFNVNCGFFNAVDNDRVYYAEQMNKPYKRVISNGVFATPEGTASTDLQVTSASDGMNIQVAPGEGLFAGKWFENPSTIVITVPANTNVIPRRDSVIVQVDTTTPGRVGNIVYREGTPSSNPQAPAINTVDGIVEYRLANINVAPSVNAINNDVIVDLRGSNSCPWVTSLIYQVDTSELFNQWQTAYSNFYEESTEDYEEYMTRTKNEWEAFVESLTDDLTVQTNVIMLQSSYTTTSTVSNIPINLPSYDYNTDILQVYINGLRAVEGANYTLNSNHTSIDLTNSLNSGQTVVFFAMKSVIMGEAETVLDAIQELNTTLGQYTSDSGWINLYMENGTSQFDSDSTPQVRKVGDRVYMRGGVQGIASNNLTICTVPTAYRPSQALIFPCVALNTSTNLVVWTGAIQIMQGGSVKILGVSSSLSSYKVSIACDWVVDNLIANANT